MTWHDLMWMSLVTVMNITISVFIVRIHARETGRLIAQNEQFRAQLSQEMAKKLQDTLARMRLQ
jgi:hypothetical protein